MKEIIYKQRRSGMTYEHELKILAQVYRLALESYQRRKQKAAVPSSPAAATTPMLVVDLSLVCPLWSVLGRSALRAVAALERF